MIATSVIFNDLVQFSVSGLYNPYGGRSTDPTSFGYMDIFGNPFMLLPSGVTGYTG